MSRVDIGNLRHQILSVEANNQRNAVGSVVESSMNEQNTAQQHSLSSGLDLGVSGTRTTSEKAESRRENTSKAKRAKKDTAHQATALPFLLILAAPFVVALVSKNRVSLREFLASVIEDCR